MDNNWLGESAEADRELVRLCYKTPYEDGKGDLVPLRGALRWVKAQQERHPNFEYWYEHEEPTK